MQPDQQIVCKTKNGIADFFNVWADEHANKNNWCLLSVAEKIVPRYNSAPVIYIEDLDFNSDADGSTLNDIDTTHPPSRSSLNPLELLLLDVLTSDSDDEDSVQYKSIRASIISVLDEPPVSEGLSAESESRAEITSWQHSASTESVSWINNVPLVFIDNQEQSAHSSLIANYNQAMEGKATIDWWFDYSRVANTANMTSPVFHVDGCPFKVMMHPAFEKERNKRQFNRFIHSDGKVLVCLKAASSTAPNLIFNIKIDDRSVVEDKAHDFSQKPTLNQEIDLKLAKSSKWVKLSFDFGLRNQPLNF